MDWCCRASRELCSNYLFNHVHLLCRMHAKSPLPAADQQPPVLMPAAYPGYAGYSSVAGFVTPQGYMPPQQMVGSPSMIQVFLTWCCLLNCDFRQVNLVNGRDDASNWCALCVCTLASWWRSMQRHWHDVIIVINIKNFDAGLQRFWGHEFDLLGSRDVIGHVAIGLGICGFLLVVHWNHASILHRFGDIKPQSCICPC